MTEHSLTDPQGATITFKNPIAASKTPPPVQPVDKDALAAHIAFTFHVALFGKMHYSENPDRHDFFDRIKAAIAKKLTLAQIVAEFETNPPTADCSQFAAGVNLLAGYTDYTDTDYTGTELPKGLLVSDRALWKPGYLVFYGPGTAEHVDRLISPNGADWNICGFGCEPGPGYGTLSGSEQWFQAHGHPGIRVERSR